MKPLLLSLVLRLVAVAACFGAVVGNAMAQGTPKAEAPETGVVLTKLSLPIYPPLARQAGIMGEVKVQIGIRQDGSIASDEVVSGHPMLKQAALDSAKKSQYECRGCDDVVAYVLTYSFVVRKFNPDTCKQATKKPEVTVERAHVTITAEALCVETQRSGAGFSPSGSGSMSSKMCGFLQSF